MSAVQERPKTVKPTIYLLIHASPENAEVCIDGRGYIIPPNKAWRVPEIVCTDHNNNGPYEYRTPSETLAKEIINKCWMYGVVEVPVFEKENEFGIQYEYDNKAAHELAKQALIKAEEQIVMNYVVIQRERMSNNLPAMPPTGRVKYVVDKRKIDLKRDYNIDPIGYGAVAKAAAASEGMETIQRQLDEQKKLNTDLTERFNKLMAQLEGSEGKKGK